MNNITIISRNTHFRKLFGKFVYNENVAFRWCGDIKPTKYGPIFSNCKIVFVDNCDKNFVYYWINKRRFPNINSIYIFDTHPCDSEVVNRFYDTRIKFYLCCEYKCRWDKDSDDVILLNSDKMKSLLSSYNEEDLIISDQNKE